MLYITNTIQIFGVPGPVHSIVLDDSWERWDCWNGWTDRISAKKLDYLRSNCEEYTKRLSEEVEQMPINGPDS